MKYKVGDKVLLKAVYTVDTVDERDSERPYVIMDRSGIRIGRYSEEDLSPAVLTPEEATEQFVKDLDSGFYDEKDTLSRDEMAKLLSGIGEEPQTYNKHQSKIDLDDTGYDDGYKDGYEEAKTEFFENRYQEGLQDAWELAQEIVAMNNRELADRHFEVNIKNPEPINAINIISVNLVTEVLDRVKAYEQERRKIKVGDIVIIEFCNGSEQRGVVTGIDMNSKSEYAVLFDDGDVTWYYESDLIQTGKHYDIQSILDQLKEV